MENSFDQSVSAGLRFRFQTYFEDFEKFNSGQKNYGSSSRIVIFLELGVELARRFNKLVLNPKIVPG